MLSQCRENKLERLKFEKGQGKAYASVKGIGFDVDKSVSATFENI